MIAPEFTLGSLALTSAPFSIEFGADLGGPETTYETLISFLLDGEDVTADRVSNRTITLSILVEGTSAQALADAEARLVAEVVKARNALAVDPGDDVGAVTVFDTFKGSLKFERDDVFEQNFFRRYTLTLPALPYPRSASLTNSVAVVTTTLPEPSIPAWYSIGGALSRTTGTDPTRTSTATAASGTLGLSRLADVELASGNVYTPPPSSAFLDVVWQTSGTGAASLALSTDYGVVAALASRANTPSAGWTTTTFFLPKATRGIRYRASFPVGSASTTASLTVREALTFRSDVPGGSRRAVARSLRPGGTARTQGSLSVDSASNSVALGDVLVYTSPGGLFPPLSSWVVTKPTADADSTAVSQSAFRLHEGAVTYEVPALGVPQARAQIWARVKATAASTQTVAVDVDGVMTDAVVGKRQTVSTSATLAANTWTIVCLGDVALPPVRLGDTGAVRFTASRSAGSGAFYVDEVWVFALEDSRGAAGALTYLPGIPTRQVWIDAPSLDDPFGSLWRGGVDRTDAVYAEPVSYMDHAFEPAGTLVYVVATGAPAPVLTSLRHFRRWHSNAGS